MEELADSLVLETSIKKYVGSNPAKGTNRVVGELVTPPDLGSGELAGSSPAYST